MLWSWLWDGNPDRGSKEGNYIRLTDLYHVETLGLVVDAGANRKTHSIRDPYPAL